MDLFTGVHQINFKVSEMGRSCKWYQEVLGLSILKDYGSTVVLGSSEDIENKSTTICLIELLKGEFLPSNQNGTYPVIAISPDKADTCKETLKELGVTIVEGGSLAHFKFQDPDGNLLEAYLPGLYEDERFKHLR